MVTGIESNNVPGIHDFEGEIPVCLTSSFSIVSVVDFYVMGFHGYQNI